MTIAQFPVPPIVKTVTVRAAPARAFALFADDLARWWPLPRVHTGPDPVDCAIEPRVGGRVFERAADGRETPWGTVLAYDPPHRLAFSWIVQLSAEQEQLVEIRFTAQDVPRLRVALRDPADKETQFKIIDPPTGRLGPAETVHFKTSFDHPDEVATGVLVTFAR